jgi:hypothetical protein
MLFPIKAFDPRVNLWSFAVILNGGNHVTHSCSKRRQPSHGVRAAARWRKPAGLYVL